MPERTIVQIVGQPGSGKSEVCNHLAEKYGFTSLLISDLIRRFADDKGILLKERADYRSAHAQLLADQGEYAITDEILKIDSELICVDGMRVPAHAARLRSKARSMIIALNCPARVRFDRSLLRARGIDSPNYEEFLLDEEQDFYNQDPFVQSTGTVMEMADHQVNSSVPLIQVFQTVDAFVEPFVE